MWRYERFLHKTCIKIKNKTFLYGNIGQLSRFPKCHFWWKKWLWVTSNRVFRYRVAKPPGMFFSVFLLYFCLYIMLLVCILIYTCLSYICQFPLPFFSSLYLSNQYQPLIFSRFVCFCVLQVFTYLFLLTSPLSLAISNIHHLSCILPFFICAFKWN